MNTESRTDTGAPLAHVKVLDLSRILAAPWASQILADLGERPHVGDDTRSWGPPFMQDAQGHDTKEAGYFLAVNRGKRSITIDLSSPEGQTVVRDLAMQSDIVLENYKVGTLEKYGLDQASLRQLNPRLIYCSVTGFGQTGPRRDQPAYDFLIQAMGGLMSVTGERAGLPGGGPQKVGVPIVDLMTGMYATVAVLSALERRNLTGKGDCIDIAMLDVQVASLANQAMNYLVSGKPPQRTGNAHPNIQPQDVFSCRDADFILVVGNDGQFVRLCAALGHPEWAQDARFKTNSQRVQNLSALTTLLRARFTQFNRVELLKLLDEVDVPCGPINTVPEVFEDPQVKARGLLRQVDHPSGGVVPQVMCPIRFNDATMPNPLAPPLLGQHSHEILRELGYSASEIKTLRQAGAI
jgi:crotonobetainyl-CoA:carnitine CoA-transferase CaiB-like acyl-CoA transferase